MAAKTKTKQNKMKQEQKKNMTVKIHLQGICQACVHHMKKDAKTSFILQYFASVYKHNIGCADNSRILHRSNVECFCRSRLEYFNKNKQNSLIYAEHKYKVCPWCSKYNTIKIR